MLGLTEIASGVAANGVGSFFSRSIKRIRSIWRRETELRRKAAITSRTSSKLEVGLHATARQLEAITDHIMHLDATSGAFHPDKVAIAARTMRAFKSPMPTVRRSGRSSNALHVTLGVEQGVIAGMQLSIKSPLGGYEETYILQSRDLRPDHVCIQPPNYNPAQVEPNDLVISFVQLGDLTTLEQELAILLDMSMSALDDCHAALTPTGG